MTKERLQKIIASSGLCSRRQAERFILENRVSINGKIARLGDKGDTNIDKIFVDETRLFEDKYKRVFLINKPIGVISSCHDQYGRSTVLNVLPKLIRKGIYPIGRLDINSRGALILTNHGELTLKLTHPKYKHEKAYLV